MFTKLTNNSQIMDFPQHFEDTLVPALYDVIMETPFQTNTKMNSSMNSNMDDTTPSDSGVQLLDSEGSELMVESITSQLDFEMEPVAALAPVDANFNVTQPQLKNEVLPVEEAMTASACSTFDTTENIVYRRKVRKANSGNKTPKKRVSFHEDILKNTRTDNIHIEHGFVTYKNGRKMMPKSAGTGRYSWCSERERGHHKANAATLTGSSEDTENLDNSADGGSRRVVYRNACSDVLDYGNSDVYDTNESNVLRYDNSGVFEYMPKDENEDELQYNCSSSSSNSSFDEQEQNANYAGQAKSSSCDCIGTDNASNNNFIDENCYFSEPSMEKMEEEPKRKKSVWNKEIKPKSSCLKKTKYNTYIIQEQDINNSVKKFNVHNMNQLLDNSSKIIIGSLKSLFTLPERGVPEGSEDLQSVVECIPESTPEHKLTQNNNQIFTTTSPTLKAKPFLSKSLDGSKQVKNFVHNVDEQLRRKNEVEMFAPTRENSGEQCVKEKTLQRQEEIVLEENAAINNEHNNVYRNKFIINCESTVFEHTGVSYCYESTGDVQDYNALLNEQAADIDNLATPVASSVDSIGDTLIATPIAKTFSKLLSSFKTLSPTEQNYNNKQLQQSTDTHFAAFKIQQKSTTTTTSTTDNSNKALVCDQQENAGISSSLVLTTNLRSQMDKQVRHLSSPVKKRQSISNPVHTQRFGSSSITNSSGVGLGSEHSSYVFSPESNSLSYKGARGGGGRDSKSTILSEDFDDILTVTTDADKSDIVILDYADCIPTTSSAAAAATSAIDNRYLLKPPQATASKTSLINRFLRNVTQKKLLDTSLKRNNFFAQKLRSEQKLLSSSLYLPVAKPQNTELIDDLNAEIAMEIEMSGVNSPRRELTQIADIELPGDVARFDMGIGEINLDIFNGNHSHVKHILRDANEQLFKVFKLYTGYSREGHMTPVLVLLTNKRLYVVDLVRNRLCSKFVLSYAELDVILMGPFGNTVLLSNSERDMQQVLLAGGPYPATGLVANLELCARRNGATLPAVGQLTLAHLAPLQAFVREHSCVDRKDTWMYYAVVQVPTGSLGGDQEPLGPHIKGFLMHRRVRENVTSKQAWNPGYFLIKAGVLYMFNDSTQKLPSWAMALAECQGARRAAKAARPHCFEILLKDKLLLQLAAPDEFVASEWLQVLLQSASGLFEMQEKHKTLGCSLILTQNHLITLREDFSAPLRQLHKNQTNVTEKVNNKSEKSKHLIGNFSGTDVNSLLGSTVSTPTRSSVNSTPTKLSQLSRSTAANEQHTASSSETTTPTNSTATNSYLRAGETFATGSSRYAQMSSSYGKNAALEILTCADIKEMIAIKIPSQAETWWCVLEFSCQEVRESSDDLIIFFASSVEMQKFLRLLEQLWQSQNNDLFPITVLDEDDVVAEQCGMLYMDINRSWEPLLSAALGYPL